MGTGTTRSKRAGMDAAHLKLPLVSYAGFDSFSRPISLKPHAHAGYELTYVSEGEVTWQVEGGELLHLTGGTIALTAPGAVHRGEWDIIRPCSLFWIIYEPKQPRARSGTPFSPAHMRAVAAELQRIGNATARANADLRIFFDMLRTHLQLFNWSKQYELQLPQLKALLIQILIEALRSFGEARLLQKSGHIERARAFMEAHCEDPLPINTVAAASGLSGSRFYELFKQQTGLTPADYFQRLRCTRAREELLHTKESITAVAYKYGFSSSQYFATCFKKYTGMSPREFRRQRG